MHKIYRNNNWLLANISLPLFLTITSDALQCLTDTITSSRNVIFLRKSNDATSTAQHMPTVSQSQPYTKKWDTDVAKRSIKILRKDQRASGGHQLKGGTPSHISFPDVNLASSLPQLSNFCTLNKRSVGCPEIDFGGRLAGSNLGHRLAFTIYYSHATICNWIYFAIFIGVCTTDFDTAVRSFWKYLHGSSSW